MALTAIFGGTFNPFHIGHYEMLEELQNDERIEKILVMPDSLPPHKTCDYLADGVDRIEMCRIAAEDFSKAELCLIEFEREGRSYSYDTVVQLKQIYPDKRFTFVCGGDMIVTLDRWYNYRELIKEIPFIAFKRNDTDRELFEQRVEQFRRDGADITVFGREITAVSSTYIRSNITNSQNLIPEKIYRYIEQRGIYLGK